MKNVFLVCAIVASVISVVSCSKAPETSVTVACINKPIQQDSTALINFANANNITVLKDVYGLYSQIITPGAGVTPTGSSIVQVTYKGTLLNGTVFDSTATGATASFNLNQLIPGWQIGIPKIKAGGRIKLLVPSALAYGCKGAKNAAGAFIIPENAPVYFDINLISVQ
ncbi:MAG: FKBP-type peptidyl-prolyl cis-trans isomerase [Deinococcales bacterium]|nr:FKBP-type peptidyl-prolyl cis-trans isomerase [Chitinophagaceae bacterium]